MIFSKSQTGTAEKKKELRKIALAHAFIQFCKNEGDLLPLLLGIGLFVHKVSWSQLLTMITMYCTQLGSQFHTWRYSSSR